MGAYLSEPVVDKESAQGTNGRLDYGASSMQGWRVTQEDAHNCLLDFETESSFFAVYDGHGGHEVAVYCAANLPQFLKDCETYKKGDFVEALKEAFMGFDAKLATPEVVAALKEIVGNKDEKNSDSEDEEENVRNLYEEAEMPLEQVMAKYQSDLNPNAKKLKGEKSPFVRGKKACTSGASGSGCSSSSMPVVDISSSSSSAPDVSSSEVQPPAKEIKFVPESKNTNGDSENKSNISRESENGISEPDSSVDTDEKSVSETKKEVETESTETEVIAKSPVKKVEVLNGDAAAEEKRPNEAGENVTSSVVRENGDGSPPYEGKGKGKAKMVKPEEASTKNNHFMALRRHAANALYKALLRPQDKSDSDSDSEDDENFEGAAESSDDDDADEDEEGKENAVAEEEGDNDDDDDDDDEEDEEEEDDDDDDDSMVDDEEDEDDDFTMKMTEEPGSDSGCTAVVALLRGCELYVANAGDSRCIVCRKGEAVEMSLDHKPEDQPESDRIVKAGGKVTADGRVNGGLNLSRALGDHAYKLNAALPPHEQMITAMPDVRTLTINPEEDEFMVLACDGIWNFMTNQEVCDFVRPRIEEGKDELSTICEALFDHCLAPNTHGDGTGCDNMTAVIVKFHPSLAATADSKSTKRLASPAKEEESTKRAKTDEPLPV